MCRCSALSLKATMLGLMLIAINGLAVVEYDLWVDNQRFTSENTTIYCSGGGTARLEPDKNNLHLDNAIITNSCTIDGLGAGIVSYLPNLNIWISKGENIISNVYGAGITTGNSVDANGATIARNIVFTQSATLRIYTTNEASGYGVYCTGSSLNPGGLFLIDIDSAKDGLIAPDGVTFGVYASNAPRVDIDARDGYGIYTTNNFIYSPENRTSPTYIKIKASKDGIYCNDFKFSHRGSIDIDAGEDGIDCRSYGRYTTRIGGLSIKAGEAGIRCEGSVNDYSTGELKIESQDDCFVLGGALSIEGMRTVNLTSHNGSPISSPEPFTLAPVASYTFTANSSTAAAFHIPSGTYDFRATDITVRSKGKGIVLGDDSIDEPTSATFTMVGGNLDIEAAMGGISGNAGSTAAVSCNTRIYSEAPNKAIDFADGVEALDFRGVIELQKGSLTGDFVEVRTPITYTWIASNPSADWNSTETWANGEIPSSSDIVRFEESMDIPSGVIPADFKGGFNVADGKSLSITFDDTTTTQQLAVAVEGGATFIKKGNGAISLAPISGSYHGDIVVEAGTVVFRGNGSDMAVGLFGKLSVASSARVAVTNSPFVDRHAGLSVGSLSGAAKYYLPNGVYTSYENIRNMWVGLYGDLTLATPRTKLYTPPHLLFTPIDYQLGYLAGSTYLAVNASYCDAVGSLVWLNSVDFPRRMDATYDNAGALYIDQTNCTTSATRSLARGWHYIDWYVGNQTGGMSGYRYFDSSRQNPGDVMTADFIWNGVCFGELSLAEGAVLDICAGQSVAVVADRFDVKGEIIGASDSCFTIALSDDPIDLKLFDSYSGMIEVGYPAKVKASSNCADANYTLIGHGEVVAADGIDARLSSEFAGRLIIPEGTTFKPVNALSPNIKILGEGTFISSKTFTPPAYGFSGDVSITEGGSATYESAIAQGWDSLKLSNDTTLSIAGSTLLKGAIEESLLDWNSGAWSLNGTTIIKNFNTGSAYVDSDGALVLTDDGGQQRRTAFLTNVVLRSSDSWRVSFTYSASQIGKYEKERAGEGLAIILQPYGPTACDAIAAAPFAIGNDNKKQLYNAFGMAFMQNQNYRTGIDIVSQGTVGSDQIKTYSDCGIDITKPVDVEVVYADKLLTFYFRQGAVILSRTVDLSILTESQGLFWFGFAAGTGTSDSDGTVVGLVQKITNFKGTILRNSYSEPLEGYSLATNNWQLNGTITNTGSLLILHEDKGYWGSAVARKPLPLTKAYAMSWQQIVYACPRTLSTDPRTRVYGSSVIQGYGTNYFNNANTGYGIPSQKPATFGTLVVCDEHETGIFPWAWILGNSVKRIGTLNAPTSISGRFLTVTNNVTMSFDGEGALTMEVARPTSFGSSSTELTCIDDFKSLGNDGWLTFIASHPTRGGVQTKYRTITYSNIVVRQLMPNDMKVGIPIEVESGATTTIELNGITVEASTPIASLGDLTLKSDSTLVLTNEFGNSIVGISKMALGGASQTIMTATNVTAALDTLDLTATSHPMIGSALLTINGNWTSRNGKITIHIPSSWVSLPSFDAINLRNATLNGTMPEFEVVLINEDGTTRSGKGVLAYVTEDGMLRLKTPARTIFMIN